MTKEFLGQPMNWVAAFSFLRMERMPWNDGREWRTNGRKKQDRSESGSGKENSQSKDNQNVETG